MYDVCMYDYEMIKYVSKLTMFAFYNCKIT